MSAVEEYRNYGEGMLSITIADGERHHWIPKTLADAAIAYLESETNRLAMAQSNAVSKLELEKRLHEHSKDLIAETHKE